MFKIGSCRIDSDPYLHNHVHNTKQILITLKYLLNNENIELYHNIHEKPLSYNVINVVRNRLINSNKVIIEISSLKRWMDLNDRDIHWASYNKTDSKSRNIKLIDQETFLNDLNEIITLLKNKKIILVSHINIDINNYKEEIKCNGLIRWVSNNFKDNNEGKVPSDIIDIKKIAETKIKSRDLIEKYIDKTIINKNIIHFKPYDYIKNTCGKNIELFFKKSNNSIDTNHYSSFGHTKIMNYLDNL